MLQIKNVCKQYRTGDLVQKALDGVSLNLRENEFVAILGPSGSGKTTLLNIIGGLDRYDSGDLIINGISTKQYQDHDWDSYRNHTIGFVFQSYNLIPHQTILSNVELALTISGISKSERKERAKLALDQVGLQGQYHKRPNQLSGGQMQRVAIARALVNNPQILLADEPTGALDSETSIQVMDLLKEVAKDRLVVMVTHNPELAKQYATRVVNLKDGVILSDTDPYVIDEASLTPPKHKNMGKTSMSFLTALALSFNNLRTKLGRTILTSFAGSIGIIGIALILSLSNGVNTYIRSVEEETLSEYPLQILSSGYDMTTMLTGGNNNQEIAEGEVGVAQMITNMFSRIGKNDLKNLKSYLDSDQTDIKDYTSTIEYEYNVMPLIFSEDTTTIHQVNPDQSFSALGIGSSSSSNSMMSIAMSTDYFRALPKASSIYEDEYEIKAGHWPTNRNECVVVLLENGKMSDFMLYGLGLRDYHDLENMINQFAQEEQVTLPDTSDDRYTYEDILGINFKVVNAADCYTYDSEYNVWIDKSDDTNHMRNLIANSEDLTVVGIVQPASGANAYMLSTGIYYPASLTYHVIEEAQTSEIVKQQLANPTINVFSQKSFATEDEDSSMNMSSLFSVDTDLMQSAFKFDTSNLNINLSDLNNALTSVSLPPLDLMDILSQLNITFPKEELQTLASHLVDGYLEYVKNHPETDLKDFGQYVKEYLESPEVSQKLKEGIEKIINENQDISISLEQAKQLLIDIANGYSDYATSNGLPDPTKINEYFRDYLNTPEVKELLSKDISSVITASGLEIEISNMIQNYMAQAMVPISSALETEITKSITQLSDALANAFTFDEQAFANSMTLNMSEEELSQLMYSLMSKEKTSYENNLNKLNYADLDTPSMISIYPKDFESKEAVIDILDHYNEDMKAQGLDEQVITYTDVVGTLMSSVTNIINVISYVLIAFVAISLVVSSIMIGIITYISVLERKKEIGILRAMGASKHNVSQVFNAETFIVGLGAGLMGILITLILLLPGNMIIHHFAGDINVKAILPIGGAIILVALSVILTLIGGIIPSKKAAKEDPVTALRTE